MMSTRIRLGIAILCAPVIAAMTYAWLSSATYVGPEYARVPVATLAMTASIVAFPFVIVVLVPTYFALKRSVPFRTAPFIGTAAVAYLACLLGAYVVFRVNWGGPYGPFLAILTGGMVLIVSFWQMAIAGTWTTAMLIWPFVPAYAYPFFLVFGVVAALPIAILWCAVGIVLSMKKVRRSGIRTAAATANALGALVYIALLVVRVRLIYEIASHMHWTRGATVTPWP